MKEDSTFRIILSILKRRLNIRTLIILILLFSVNSYAWFIYSTKVNSGVTAKVKAWNVLFQVGDVEISQDMSFSVRDIYPGMQDYSDSITVTNRGDTNATFSYEITSINILGYSYAISPTITSNDLSDILRNNYPFKITIGTSSSVLAPLDDASFSISVTWPYESGDDETDTLWGNRAYEFKTNNPMLPCIDIQVTVSAYQNNNA